jgi:hypothetical protein
MKGSIYGSWLPRDTQVKEKGLGIAAVGEKIGELLVWVRILILTFIGGCVMERVGCRKRMSV